MHELTRAQARRIAVQAQLLDAERPTELHAVVRQLTLLQIDPTAAIAPNADLVAWSRLGSSYAREDLTAALANRTLLELRAMIRPSEDLALYRADMAVWERDSKHYREWVAANDACRRDILERLGGQGPLTSRELPDTCAVPWKSSGWTHNRNVSQLLELMVLAASTKTPNDALRGTRTLGFAVRKSASSRRPAMNAARSPERIS
uniref:DNA glycosylase AlkZ-like family protein n=1 Tax=Streptomyces sp. Agncl-13 TaxID=3400628 RepID=UPI003A8362C6